MSINRSIKKVLALVLVVAAVAAVVVTQIGGRSVAAGAGHRPAASTRANQGSPNAVPPILPRESASQIAALDAWEGAQFKVDPSANGRYSRAEMNAYGTAHK
jgi:cell division protein FtsN